MNESTASNTPKKLYHVPVMKTEILDELAKIPPSGWIVDGTYGDGGHSKAIYDERVKMYDLNRLLSIDWDLSGYIARISHGGDVPTLQEEMNKTTKWVLYKENFSKLDRIISDVDRKVEFSKNISGLVLDLGISSRQYVQRKRGFSFSSTGRADMRMDPDNYAVAAYDLLNNLTFNVLRKLFVKTVGMPDFMAVALVKAIIAARSIRPFGNSDDIERLNEIAYEVNPIRKNSVGRIHPATLLFLALRIAVNTELQNLQEVLPQALKLANNGAKFLILTYHSGEEAIVERFAYENNLRSEVILPTKREIRENNRARSAKLFVISV